MPQYRVGPIGGSEFYWVLAASDDEAKRLIALNVSSIDEDVTKLECVLDDKFNLPNDVIMTFSGNTLTVSKR